MFTEPDELSPQSHTSFKDHLILSSGLHLHLSGVMFPSSFRSKHCMHLYNYFLNMFANVSLVQYS